MKHARKKEAEEAEAGAQWSAQSNQGLRQGLQVLALSLAR
jgi:hypothetical protein